LCIPRRGYPRRGRGNGFDAFINVLYCNNNIIVCRRTDLRSERIAVVAVAYSGRVSYTAAAAVMNTDSKSREAYIMRRRTWHADDTIAPAENPRIVSRVKPITFSSANPVFHTPPHAFYDVPFTHYFYK